MSRSVKIAIAMSLLATLWILSGSLSSSTSDEVAAAKPAANAAAPFKVQAVVSQAQSTERRVNLQGEVDALRTVTIRAETAGRIQALGSAKGSRLAKDALIAQIAPNDRPARLEKARANLALREADMRAGLKLRDRQMLSDLQHQQNQAAVVAARAEVSAIEVELEQTRILAPYPALLSERHVEVGDHVSVGDAIATLVDDSAALIRAEIPQQHIAQMAPGLKVRATLLDGREIPGRISYVASHANSNTRTFAMEALTESTQGLLHFGQSARIEVTLGTAQAHFLSPSVLDLTASGSLQIKTVSDEGLVEAFEVTLLRNERNGVWVTGLPEQATVITVGQGFVRAGEAVSIANGES